MTLTDKIKETLEHTDQQWQKELTKDIYFLINCYKKTKNFQYLKTARLLNESLKKVWTQTNTSPTIVIADQKSRRQMTRIIKR